MFIKFSVVGIFNQETFYQLSDPTEDVSAQARTNEFAYEIVLPDNIDLSTVNQSDLTWDFAQVFGPPAHPDIFVQKSPACTLIDLAQALKEIFEYKKDIIIIGTRHGEKLYESLLSREEMARVEDNGKFFRLPSDNRGLNYDSYFEKGKEINEEFKEYTSHNTDRLNVKEIKEILLNLDFIKNSLIY